MPTADTEQPKPLRDINIDRIGYVNELVSQFVNDAKTKLKNKFLLSDTKTGEGDQFTATFISGGETLSADPAKLLKMHEAGKITTKQLVSALRVNNEAAAVFLSKEQLRKISTASPQSPTLRITRKKGVQIQLVDALKGLNAAIAEA